MTSPDSGIKPAPFDVQAFVKKPQNLWRILLLILALGILFCFFTPQFYLSITVKFLGATSKNWKLLFGWSTWWGIVSFILTFMTIPAIVADIALHNVATLRSVLRFVYPAIFLLLSATTFLGIVLLLLGVGLNVKTPADEAGPLLGEAFKDMVSVFRFPLMALPLLVLTVAAAGVAGFIVFKELQFKGDTRSAATVSGSPPTGP